jgi:hypothetical protein
MLRCWHEFYAGVNVLSFATCTNHSIGAVHSERTSCLQSEHRRQYQVFVIVLLSGSVDIMKLTTTNLIPFQVNIPFANVPKTSLDAFLVTLRLGYEYISIDSFCIMQDSEDDWTAESKQMGDTYRNSDCTIAALKFINYQGGLFTERLNLSLLPCQLRTKTDNLRVHSSLSWSGMPKSLSTSVHRLCRSINSLVDCLSLVEIRCLGNASKLMPQKASPNFAPTSLKGPA